MDLNVKKNQQCLVQLQIIQLQINVEQNIKPVKIQV